MSLDKLYRTLRALVSDKYQIEIRDGTNPTAVIVPDSRCDTQPWIKFEGTSLEDCLMRAITKLSNPDMNYHAKPTILDPEGFIWKANEDSIYSEKHIKLFLKTEPSSIINQGERT